MPDEIKRAFDHIKADSRLKEKTYEQLSKKMRTKRKSVPGRYAVSLASLVLLAGISWIFYFFYTTEAAVLDIDVNPGIEFSLNHFDRVIGTYGYNEEGRSLLENIDVKNKSYQDAISTAVSELSEMGYLPRNSLLTATLITNDTNKNDSKLTELKEYIGKMSLLKSLNIKQDIFSVDDDTKHYSHIENISPAKYLAILELQDIDPTASFESCHDESIEEIKNQTHRHQNEAGGTNHGDDKTDKRDYKEKNGKHHSESSYEQDENIESQGSGIYEKDSGQNSSIAENNDSQSSLADNGGNPGSGIFESGGGQSSIADNSGEQDGNYNEGYEPEAQQSSGRGGHHGGGHQGGGRHGMH